MYERIFLPRKINKGNELFFCKEKEKKEDFEENLKSILILFFFILFGFGK